ncbi:MAG: hypothetical protein M3Y73_07065 [Actinomycetota bacterium]|nr:hypothetical protein [Actinomycetota bacterium]
MTVIAELLGLPISDRELFRTWADRLFHSDMTDPNDPELPRKIDDATADMLAYLREHCADRRAHPREDLISRLAAVEADGERLTDEEVVNFSVVLLIAGHITTTALLGNTVLCLDEQSQVWAQLRADRSLVEPTIEEVLRYRSSFTQVGQVTTAETELSGQGSGRRVAGSLRGDSPGPRGAGGVLRPGHLRGAQRPGTRPAGVKSAGVTVLDTGREVFRITGRMQGAVLGLEQPAA